VNPLYLGTAERRIFGIHEPAAATVGRPKSVVLCYPWGAEYIYAHRAMRQLAIRLSMSGYHTMRFDYFGTGDSGGEFSQADLQGWQSDAEFAIEAVKEIAGASKVALVGLRIGANVAASVAQRLPSEIEGVVLWDPIVSGKEYLKKLEASAIRDDKQEGPLTWQVAGFPLTDRFRRDFESIELDSMLASPPVRTLVLVTERLDSHQSLGRGSRDAGSATVEFVAAPCPWIELATTTGALPMQVIQRIEEWLR
jgi:pimeloyl-ACP methyl ester carboxylesterase